MQTTRDLQERLKALGYNPGIVDGAMGPKTRAAVSAFQRAYGLVVDGIAGPQTKAALKQANTPAQPGRVEPDKSAMAKPVERLLSPGNNNVAPPPNVASLRLLDTAREIDEIVIHCAATPEGRDFTVADIRAWHKSRGFSDIGYHYIVYRDGRIMLGRPVGQQGAHTADHGKNRGTIGVCYIGGVAADAKAAKDTRTAAQRSSLLWLTQELRRKHTRIRKVSGHNEYAAKACPSFDVRRDALARVGA